MLILASWFRLFLASQVFWLSQRCFAFDQAPQQLVPDVRTFGIIFVRSSGSTALASWLNTQPDIVTHDEYVGKVSVSCRRALHARHRRAAGSGCQRAKAHIQKNNRARARTRVL